MRKVKLSALLFGATLFIGMGVTTLSAEMKCGAGKCGSSPAKQKKYMNRDSGKCGAENRNMMRDDDKQNRSMMRDDDMPNRNMMRDDDTRNRDMKRQDGKCGGNN